MTADSVLSSLKRLANKGVLVMASVHCPSSDAVCVRVYVSPMRHVRVYVEDREGRVGMYRQPTPSPPFPCYQPHTPTHAYTLTHTYIHTLT